jgi:nitrite reductase/ring-hydroxylating ferredoxin subunit/uncharacterized membrane protein
MAIPRSLFPDLTHLSERVANSLPWLDSAAGALHSTFDPILGEGGNSTVKDALYGTWLGHPLHPMMTDLPIGFWTSSMVLDLLGMEEGADLTLKLGTLSALGTAVTGVAQWHDLQEMETPKRLGTLHAALNVAATASYGLSWMLRSKDSRGTAQVFSTVGFMLASVSGMIGGDLSYRLGIGVSRVAFEEPSGEWVSIGALADFEDGQLKRIEQNDIEPIVVLRDGDTVIAASATCSHVGGPLDEGERDGTCVTCPWHGSEFDLRDGRVIHGPATSPLHAYETRVTGDQVEIRVIAA